MIEKKRSGKSTFQRHLNILIWKSYLQRQRRWRLLLAETLFAAALFLCAIFIAKPVFLTPLQEEPVAPMSSSDILATFKKNTIIGYAPNIKPFNEIMEKVGTTLNVDVMQAESEDDLNEMLYMMSRESEIQNSIIWVIWKPKNGFMWQLSIRSTDRARYLTGSESSDHNSHLKSGFLAVQLAISQAIIEHLSHEEPKFEMNLVSMPVSPLMQEYKVRVALSRILLCFTVALLPPVLETEALVIHETVSRWKRGLRMRGVAYSAMYIGWLSYAYFTALPICFLASVSLILIFRWIHIIFAMALMSAYLFVMIMLALIMAMFNTRALIAGIWSTSWTLLQTYLAEMLVHHQYDEKHGAIVMLLHVLIPPLGLVNSFNQFALLQTGRSRLKHDIGSQPSLALTIGSWLMVIMVYFMILMLLQRTLRQGGGAIGGQVSWKSIIFKSIETTDKLRTIENPTGDERRNLQEVDEHVAKAITFRNVSKNIMGEQVLSNITMDIYRGEYTMIFCESIQSSMIGTVEDLLVGLTLPDKGSIYILGQKLSFKRNYFNELNMMGYCHRSVMLIEDLTVEEHLTLFYDICLWQETRDFIIEYSTIRLKRIMIDCDLKKVWNVRVGMLHHYYKAQLSWAIATLLEPRVIILPNFSDHPKFTAVIKDKVMRYKKNITLVKTCFTTIQLGYADRVFVLDLKLVAFGGTPAYMFFKYGREYRVRMTLRSDGADNEATSALLFRAAVSGATVRAHLGSLLILRLPVTPTNVVADLVSDLMEHSKEFGLISMTITVADSEEVFKRTIFQSRQYAQENEPEQLINDDVKRTIGADKLPWKRVVTCCANITHFRNIGWKVFAFYVHYRLFFIITVLTAILTGILMGSSFAMMLKRSEREDASNKLLHGDLLTIEAMVRNTVIMIRADDSDAARSLANAYVLSEPNVTETQLKNIVYSALPRSQSLKDYLATRAIDAPQLYVFLYAYGLGIRTNTNDMLDVQVLYSPLHFDQGAAARAMAKAYTALLRHYTKQFNASIQITDDPLALDLTPWMIYAKQAPLMLQLLLILSITHITFIPSKERGFISHMQKHAFNFSPARYWFTLFFWDVIIYWWLVMLITGSMMGVMYLTAPSGNFYYEDLYLKRLFTRDVEVSYTVSAQNPPIMLVIPFMLVVYGMVCVPQAYLFSYGPRVGLNAMIFIIVNLIFGETTILAKIFFGDFFTIAVILMGLSPQYNMAYAFVKIKQIFLYNSECIIFEKQKLCSSTTLHKCCEKCGVLQKCFYRQKYLDRAVGIRTELISMLTTCFIFMTIVLLIEYKVFKRLWKFAQKWKDLRTSSSLSEALDSRTTVGCDRERKDVLYKREQMKSKRSQAVNKFGECLLVNNVCKKEMGSYTLHSIFLGLSKGEALALAGLKRHGRMQLCDILSGFSKSTSGSIFCMSKYKHDMDPHNYARHISYCSERESLPSWMTVTDGLELIGLLRGIPKKYVKQEVKVFVDVLELSDVANVLICRLTVNQRTRLHFIAAVIGAPPVIIIDEGTAYQRFHIRRVMYYTLYHLRRRGHALFISSSSLESHMPITNRLAFLLDGTIDDIDSIDSLAVRYSRKGYTIVMHLKQEVVLSEIHTMFESQFRSFAINDTTEVLVNVQVFDEDLTWATIFGRMEVIKTENENVYSYIITVIPIDYIYNSLVNNERGKKVAEGFISDFKFMRKKQSLQKTVYPSPEALAKLKSPQQRFDITTLKELPWSVIFHR